MSIYMTNIPSVERCPITCHVCNNNHYNNNNNKYSNVIINNNSDTIGIHV